MRSSVRCVTFLACVYTLFLACAAEAQRITGTLTGVVSDPSGQPIAGASILASDGSKGVSRSTVSDGQGRYRFADLAPAAYDVSAAAPGFESTRHTVVVALDSLRRLDFSLPLAGIVQSVDVRAEVNPLQTESSDLGHVLAEQRIRNLPLNRRDFLQLALLTPGVNPPAEGSELSSRGSFAMHANGGREEYNNFLLDGADNNDPYVNRYVVQPPVDSIQEFKIATNSYSAEYGRAAAGQVNVITRSGSNQPAGSAYEYFRNDALNARNAFDGATKPPFDRHQFGLSLGGPLWRDRTFVFGSIDFLYERRRVTRLSTVPTDRMRTGELSELSAIIVDPFTRQPFAGKVVPSIRIDPIALKVLHLFPRANRPGLSGNYLFDAPFREDQRQAVVRLDHRVSPAGQLTARYNYGLVDAFDPYAEGTDTVPGFGNAYRDPAHNGMLQYEQVLGASAVSTTRVSYNNYARDIVPENDGTNVGALWGVNWLQVPVRDFAYPLITVAGFTKVGDATGLPIRRRAATIQASEHVTVDRGRHLFRFGADVRHQRLDGHLDILARGSLSFSGAISGSGLSDLLLGYPSFGLQSKADNTLQMRTTAFGVYAQDDWKAGRNLALNLGVRYEYDTPAVDPDNRMSSFAPATGTVVPVGTGGVTRSGIRPDRNNIAPRVGFAWQAGGDWVVRGGYGLYFDSGMFEVGSAQYFNPPQFTMRVYFPTQYSLLTLANPFPTGGGITPPASISTLDPDLVSSFMQHWNLSLQHHSGRLGTMTASYAGSRGSHLARARDLNQPRPGGGDVQGRRPHASYGSIFYIESEGRSAYRALQLHWERPVVHGVSASASYTWSRSMDDGSAFLGTAGDPNFPQDSANMAAQWGPSTYDIRHRVAGWFTWQLPSGNPITRNTDIRGLVAWQSAAPFTPLLRFDNSNTGNTGQQSGSDHPNVSGSVTVSNPTADRWFNTSAFSVPAPYTFGNAGRNILRGDSYASVDLAIARRIPMGGRAALSVEVQAFNVFNQVNYDLPEHYVDEPAAFGRVFSAKAPRQVQLAVRVRF